MPRGVDLISCHFIYHVSSITDSQVSDKFAPKKNTSI